jgi:hypothetical protein
MSFAVLSIRIVQGPGAPQTPKKVETTKLSKPGNSYCPEQVAQHERQKNKQE